MTQPAPSEYVPGQPGARFDPYVRLIRSLLPRTTSIAMFGTAGELVWSTDTMAGPDLINAIDDALLGANTHPDSPGQLRILEGNQPVLLCPLRDEAKKLLAMVAVLTRAEERRAPEFKFSHQLIAPALECLRRELTAQTTIAELNQTVGGLDKDLALLLAQGITEPPPGGADGAHELQMLLQQTIEHLRAVTGALLVPEKNVTLVRAAAGRSPDTNFLMRAHRKLLAQTQTQSELLVLNETQSPTAPEAFPYRVLCGALRSRAGRHLGLMTLVREASTEPFSERDAHIAAILARKAIGVIESSYDALSGLYTRAAFEPRVRSMLSERKAAQSWSVLYIDVDQLHALNEKSGMHVGDAALGQLGELIRKRLPPGAFGARISGDRFVVLLPASVRDAETFAESLRA
ncbi:MAG: GGDEF domain-containing protein, partial [Gammaproteobacteria bacterium]|nr:GGDEF domain-containing protein [Gammaproteobacteria bacterium]